MPTDTTSIKRVNIEEELQNSYLDYAMSVIIGRALPDARDGLKPVHRRILFGMDKLNNHYNKGYKKSARIVGDIIGKYHPHGDSAVYDAVVRMAQPFSLRYCLIDGQGNFGSVDGDSAAAMRYTEVRMTKITQKLLMDLDKETVDHSPNYDGNEFIPDVLPTRIPNLLVNGSSGIAVGMATNIPPHNISEIITACLLLINKPESSIDDLIEVVTGPDFPTQGIIKGRKGIIEAYKTGKGRIKISSKTEIVNNNNKEQIIISELPYQVNKSKLIEKIAELVKNKKITGISDIRDESNKKGIRVVIDIKRGDYSADVVLNNLYAQTQLKVVYGINLVALSKNKPKLFNLKELIEEFLDHRREVVTRRTVYELRKAKEKMHILEGLVVSLVNIDEIIKLIKGSKSPAEAKKDLIDSKWEIEKLKDKLPESAETFNFKKSDGATYSLSETQAQSILELKLQKLTSLEYEKIFEDYKAYILKIIELKEILSNSSKLTQIIVEELKEIKEEFGDDRKTEIAEADEDLQYEDLITPEEVVVTLSKMGYVKYQPVTEYQAQKRGGKGKCATKVKDTDFVETLLTVNTRDTLLCFSNKGMVYWTKAYQLPLASRISKGQPIVNILPLSENEKITAILPIKEYQDDLYIIKATACGIVKKTPLKEYSRPRCNGIIAVKLKEGDKLINVALTDNNCDIMLFSKKGKVVRFDTKDVRAVGRNSQGVKGINLDEQDSLVSMIIPKNDNPILTITQHGYGKRTELADYMKKSRATKGVCSIKVSERNGDVVGAAQVSEEDEILMISNKGTLVRTKVTDVSIVGRNTHGVTLIKTGEEEEIVGLEVIKE